MCYVFSNDTVPTYVDTLSHTTLFRSLFHVLVGCGLLMLKVSRLKLPVIWLLVSMWLNTLTKSHITGSLDRKSGSAGMPRPISYAVFCLKKKSCWNLGLCVKLLVRAVS